VEFVKARKKKVQSWFLDLSLVLSYWGGKDARSYHHTAPVNAIYGLNEALQMVREEGLEQAWRRHAVYSRALKAGLESIGFKYLVAEEYRLPQLSTVYLPEGLEDAKARRYLLDEFGIEVGGGLGQFAGKIWRIGLMGQSASKRNVLTALSAIETIVASAKGQSTFGRATAASSEILSSIH
jgi:alanine-glyoxylate transaminase/serine-glyoxylate transaminase/serine-pyruvate transaminase